MPTAHATAAQTSGPAVPSVSSERMVSMMGVIGWFSAKPLSAGVIESVAERYLRLGLQLDRHVEGIVDAYFGPAELATAVQAAPPVEPRNLVAAAERLLSSAEGLITLLATLRDSLQAPKRNRRG